MTPLVRRIALGVSILIVAFYAYWIPHLATITPAHYSVTHWAATWVGLDCVEVGLVVLTALLVWRSSRFCAIPAAMLAGVMISDAWFDNLTAHGNDIAEAQLSLIPELGLATASTLLAYMLLAFTFRRSD